MILYATIAEQTCIAIVSRNTRRGEQPWRVSLFWWDTDRWKAWGHYTGWTGAEAAEAVREKFGFEYPKALHP